MDRAVFPPFCLTWGQSMVEVMKIIVTSFKRSHAGMPALSAPDPAAGHRQPKPPPGTPGHYRQVWVNLLWSHCFFLLGPDVYKVFWQSRWMEIEGRVLIFSCENSKLTTHWTTINRRMLGPTKKRFPTSKGKEKPQQDGSRLQNLV